MSLWIRHFKLLRTIWRYKCVFFPDKNLAACTRAAAFFVFFFSTWLHKTAEITVSTSEARETLDFEVVSDKRFMSYVLRKRSLAL